MDLTRVLAGPFATQILADLGADVLKVESPSGDETRTWGPPFFATQSVYYLSTNRNKKSTQFDFNCKADIDRLRQLVAKADVFVENFKVGGLARWSLDYASLQKLNSKLIYCSITGFGQSGPYADRPGYDALIQAMGGLMSLTGPDSTTPTKTGVAITDILTGLYAVIGILSAIFESRNSQMGQHIDLALLDCQIAALSHRAMNFLVTGNTPTSMGNAHPNIVPYQPFATQDGWIYLAIGNQGQFKSLCQQLNTTWHCDPRFNSNSSRVIHRAELIDVMEAKLKLSSTAQWTQTFHRHGIPCAEIRNLKQVSEDPHVKQKNIFTTMSDGKTPCIKNPLNFSRTPISNYDPPPKLNQNPNYDFSSTPMNPRPHSS